MPRHPHQPQAETPPQTKVAPEEPIVRRISSDTIEMTPVVVKPGRLAETFELAKDEPVTAEVKESVPGPIGSVEPPKTIAVALGDKPLSQMTREELMERLNSINASTRVARPQNETPHERPKMTERQMTQREAELARGAERVAANAAQKIAPRPPLTAVTPGRQDPLLKPPLPLQTPVIEPTMAQARAEPDTEYVPDMQHGYIETGKRSPAEYKGG